MKRLLRRCSLGVLIIALLVWIVCPRPDLYGDTAFSAAVTDRDDKLMRLGLADDERYRLQTSFDDIPSALIDATLAYEDRYFYWHPGVNPIAIARAAWSSFVVRHRKMGASTISMQLARLRFSLNTRTASGKLEQVLRALQLERHYSKNALLSAYLNLAPYGGNIEGVGAAARIYFDKSVSELNALEAATLAVIPQNPNARFPETHAGRAAVLAARARLLASADEKAAVDGLPVAVRSRRQLPFMAPHLTTHILSGSSKSGVLPSTVNASLQIDLESHVQRYIKRMRHRGLDNASALLIDHRSMEVLASVGSANFNDASIHGQVDGTRAQRSPGSALKPFIYGLALDRGLIHPLSLLKDTPVRFRHYAPENFDRGFRGPLSARDALIYSRNVPAIRLLSEIGIESVWELLRRARIDKLREAEHYGLALALGGNEVSMRELASLYAALANGGRWQALRERRDAAAETPVALMSAEASFLVLDMLADNPRPDALSLATPATRISWKTGTSFANRDAWSVGVIGPYVLVVWTGHFDGRSNASLVGRQAAAPLFFQIADALPMPPEYDNQLHALPIRELNLRRVSICARTGELAGKHCPQLTETWFIPGTSPIRTASIFREISINTKTGLRSCHNGPETRPAVYEFWPSDVRSVFERAGIATSKAPGWSPQCSGREQAGLALAPKISSPLSELRYIAGPQSSSQLALSAVADDEVETLYWFVDNEFVGAQSTDQTVFWTMRPGVHQVLVIDDLGQRSASTIHVASAPSS